ncbi:hypothetical protein ACH6EH_06900 [Paenibacillus sp. JSM ZJ436]|uniref:hypothetical protein n=1 Tax=Paenibacillus sp. JSM ZJ436 TaxID=3376190 RepID=UPI00379A191C
MNRITFADVDNVVTEVTNGIVGYRHTKEKAQRLLLKTIWVACKEYESNHEFKTKMDDIAKILLKDSLSRKEDQK